MDTFGGAWLAQVAFIEEARLFVKVRVNRSSLSSSDEVIHSVK